MDPFLITLAVLVFLATVIALVRARRRDKCLKDLDGFHITMVEQGSNLCWGRAEVYATGMEVTYVEPVLAREGHWEHSFIFYEDQYEALNAVYRYAKGLTEEARRRRMVVINRTVRPGFWRRLGRRLQNWISMIRDALVQAMTMVIGAAKTRQPGSTVLMGAQEAQIKALSTEVIGHVGNAYDPLLERHLFSQVVLEVTRNGRKRSYCGWLKDYTSRFIEVLDAEVNIRAEHLPEAAYAPNDDRLAEVSIQAENGRLTIRNNSEMVLYVRSLEAENWQRLMGCVLPADTVADLLLPPEVVPADVRVWIGSVDRIDMVVPRAHAVIRHAAQGPGLGRSLPPSGHMLPTGFG